jgi:hypothetical protein
VNTVHHVTALSVGVLIAILSFYVLYRSSGYSDAGAFWLAVFAVSALGMCLLVALE